MSLLLIFVICFLGILLGKYHFKKWFNHLTLYSLIFGGSLFLYELKLLPYIEINQFTWLILISSFISFLMGVMTIISARNLAKENPIVFDKSDISLKIFSDDGRTVKYFILILSAISIYATIEFWSILIKQFGSIPAVILNAQVIYRLSVSGELKGATPYIFLSGYIAVFFAGIYTAYKGKFMLITFIPLLSIIIREIAGAGRVGMLIAFVEFALTFFLFRNLLKNDPRQRFRFSKVNAVIFSIILVAIFLSASSLVRISRATEKSESYSGTNRTLLETRENFFISPSMYLYASSGMGVLSKYFSSQIENTRIGENTFLSVYLFLAKLDLVKKPHEFQRGYHIPMWTNTGTYLRELYADFGITGVLLVPFLIGLSITWLWFKFYKDNNLIIFAILVYLNIIVCLSFFVMATRVFHWSGSLLIIIVIIPLLEKIATLISSKNRI